MTLYPPMSGRQIQNSQDYQNFILLVGGKMERFTDNMISSLSEIGEDFYDYGLSDATDMAIDQLGIVDEEVAFVVAMMLMAVTDYDPSRWFPQGTHWLRWKSLTPAIINEITQKIPAQIGRSKIQDEFPIDKLISSFRNILGTLAGWVTTMANAALWGDYVSAIFNMMRGNPWVSDWVWVATLDQKTCAGCVAMHGTVHPYYEELHDHPNGRCIPVPLVKQAPNWIGNRAYNITNPDVGSGVAWFRQQSVPTQRGILGNAMFEAWSQGKVNLEDMAVVVNNPAYGNIVRRASLRELL